ncbi:uncharacterized protein G6M90_00g099060 [Metarhizium brunneum]|uniref:Uncharacterized protein n=1 Tax=Metarhizium brunneum TaxID=500148 RepID=A0A7D5V522_9HYPO
MDNSKIDNSERNNQVRDSGRQYKNRSLTDYSDSVLVCEPEHNLDISRQDIVSRGRSPSLVRELGRHPRLYKERGGLDKLPPQTCSDAPLVAGERDSDAAVNLWLDGILTLEQTGCSTKQRDLVQEDNESPAVNNKAFQAQGHEAPTTDDNNNHILEANHETTTRDNPAAAADVQFPITWRTLFSPNEPGSKILHYIETTLWPHMNNETRRHFNARANPHRYLKFARTTVQPSNHAMTKHIYSGRGDKTKMQVDPEEPQALVLTIMALATWGDAKLRERNPTYLLICRHWPAELSALPKGQAPGIRFLTVRQRKKLDQEQGQRHQGDREPDIFTAEQQTTEQRATDQPTTGPHMTGNQQHTQITDCLKKGVQSLNNSATPHYLAEALVRIEQKIDWQNEAIIRQKEEITRQGIQMEQNARRHDVLYRNVAGLYGILRLPMGFEGPRDSLSSFGEKSDDGMEDERE